MKITYNFQMRQSSNPSGLHLSVEKQMPNSPRSAHALACVVAKSKRHRLLQGRSLAFNCGVTQTLRRAGVKELLCHPREGGDPMIEPLTGDSRLRGNDRKPHFYLIWIKQNNLSSRNLRTSPRQPHYLIMGQGNKQTNYKIYKMKMPTSI